MWNVIGLNDQTKPSFTVVSPKWILCIKMHRAGQWTALLWLSLPEVESLRTSLASKTSSRTHFEVLGLGLGLEASSPWPWPRSLMSSKIALSSARGQHYFWTVEILLKTPETSGKICKYLFYFAQLEHRLSQAGLHPPIEISSMTKMWQKSLLFLQFQFLFSVFRLHQ